MPLGWPRISKGHRGSSVPPPPQGFAPSSGKSRASEPGGHGQVRPVGTEHMFF